MRENKLERYLDQSKIIKIKQEAEILQEDLEFFKMYLKRNKKSSMCFEITPFKHRGRKLFHELWNSYYSYKSAQDQLHILLTEIEAVNEILSECMVNVFDIPKIAYLKTYFRKNYEIELVDYIGDFFGCSSTAEKIIKRIRTI